MTLVFTFQKGSSLKLVHRCAAILLVCLTPLWLASAASAAPCTSGATGGRVFEDYDQDGLRDSLEPGFGVGGMSVNAYGSDGTLLYQAPVGANGAYSFGNISVTAQLRLELSGLPAYMRSGAVGTDNQSAVRFTGTTGCGNHFAVHAPSTYCEQSPQVALPCYQNGGGSENTAAGVVSIGYDNSGNPAAYGGSGPNPTPNATVAEVGSTWGGAFQRTSRRAYFAALLKRHVGLGPRGMGGVYVLDYSTPTPSIVTSFSVDGVSPTNGGAAIDTGSVTRTIVPGTVTGDNDLSSDPTKDSIDLDSYHKIARTGLGDAAISEDENTLWLVNLFQRALISIDVSGDSSTLPGNISQFPLSGLTGFPNCTGGEFRPFAIEFHRGRGYIGGVCDAAVSQVASDLRAVVLSFDPSGVTTGLTEEISFALNYTREPVISGRLGTGVGVALFGTWRPWHTDYLTQVIPYAAEVLLGSFHAVPQPVLSNLRFTENGSLVLGFMDRFSNQSGYYNRFPLTGTGSTFEGMSGGEIIQVCNIAENWVLEGQSGCTRADADTIFTNDGPSGNGEYFRGDNYFATGEGPATATHSETALGGLGVVLGRGEVFATSFDPLSDTLLVRTNGTRRFSSIDSSVVDEYLIVPDPVTFPGYFGKSGGLGEPILLCQAAPIEIGNRLWVDSNRNGIQDPGEPILAGVVVRLLDSNGSELCSVTTNAEGEYLFSSQAGTSSDGRCYGISALIPSVPGYVISISLAQTPLAGLSVTGINSDSTTGGDFRDSDCSLLSGAAIMTVQTGTAGDNDHSFDCGFASVECGPTDLSPALALIDGNAGALDAYVQVAIATRDAFTRIRRCPKLNSQTRATILENAMTVYMDAWATTWLQLPQYDYSSCVQGGLSCTATDVTGVKAIIDVQARFLADLGEMVLSDSCMTRQLPQRHQALANFRTQLLSEIDFTEQQILNELGSYADSVLVCQ